jgi:hypothetical protein
MVCSLPTVYLGEWRHLPHQDKAYWLVHAMIANYLVYGCDLQMNSVIFKKGKQGFLCSLSCFWHATYYLFNHDSPIFIVLVWISFHLLHKQLNELLCSNCSEVAAPLGPILFFDGSIFRSPQPSHLVCTFKFCTILIPATWLSRFDCTNKLLWIVRGSGADLWRIRDGSHSTHGATVVLFTLRVVAASMVGGAQGTPTAGLRPRPAREKGFPSNLLFDLIDTSPLFK